MTNRTDASGSLFLDKSKLTGQICQNLLPIHYYIYKGGEVSLFPPVRQVWKRCVFCRETSVSCLGDDGWSSCALSEKMPDLLYCCCLLLSVWFPCPLRGNTHTSIQEHRGSCRRRPISLYRSVGLLFCVRRHIR